MLFSPYAPKMIFDIIVSQRNDIRKKEKKRERERKNPGTPPFGETKEESDPRQAKRSGNQNGKKES